MEYTLGKSAAFMQLLRELYTNPVYIERLNAIKQRMRPVHAHSHAQFDDIEAEIVCLLLMHVNPSLVYEFSPNGGWSTQYMLNTLDVMNSESGRIVSFDTEDHCTRNINPIESLNRRWTFVLGNVEEQYKTFSTEIDYLFIDCDHSAPFARKYIDEVLTPLLAGVRASGKRMFVSVHDVFHSSTPSEEGALVIEFLNANGIEYFSPANAVHKAEIADLRDASGLDTKLVHYYTANSCIFFVLE